MAVGMKRGVEDTAAVFQDRIRIHRLPGGGVPNSRRPVPTGGHNQPTIRTKLYAPHDIRVPQWRHDWLAGGHVPNTSGVVLTGRCDPRPIRAEDSTVDPALVEPFAHQSSSASVPDSRGIIPTRGDDQCVIRA